jgi:outer membrane protein
MMPKIIRPLTLAAFAMFAAPLAWSQEGLLEIYQRALQNDPSIREAEANYRATAEIKPQARSNLLPGLSLSAGRSSNFSESASGAVVPGTGQVVDTGNEFTSTSESLSLNLNQTIFDWAQYTQLRQADKTVARAETDFEVAKQDLLLRVSEAYFNVLAAEDTLASEVAARESIARQLEQAQRRFEVGLIAITDVQESQAGFDQAVAAEIQAQRALATAQEFLREIIGEYVAELAGPSDDLPLMTPEPANAEEWVRTAMRQNLTLISSRINADIVEDDITIQRAGRLPTLSFSAGVTDRSQSTLAIIESFDPVTGLPLRNVNNSLQEPEGYNWSFDLRVPLFTGGLNSSRIQQAVYRHRAALENLERVARQTERQTRDAYLGVISEISRVRALRQAVESSETALRATEAGFEVGTRTTVDVLASQDVLRRAQTNYARSRYDYMLNVLRLQQAAGSLSIEDIEQVDGWLQQ